MSDINPFDDFESEYDWGSPVVWDEVSAMVSDLDNTLSGVMASFSDPFAETEEMLLNEFVPKWADFTREFTKIDRLVAFNGDPFKEWSTPTNRSEDFYRLIISYDEREKLLGMGTFRTRVDLHPTFESAYNWLKDTGVLTCSYIYFDGVSYSVVVADDSGNGGNVLERDNSSDEELEF